MKSFVYTHVEIVIFYLLLCHMVEKHEGFFPPKRFSNILNSAFEELNFLKLLEIL
jgi:hypothetical protein